MSRVEQERLAAIAVVIGIIAFTGAYLQWYWLMAMGILLVRWCI